MSNINNFLKELTELSNKYGLYIEDGANIVNEFDDIIAEELEFIGIYNIMK